MRHIRELVPCLRASVAVFDFAASEGVVQAIHASGETALGMGARLPLGVFGSVDKLRQSKVNMIADAKTLPDTPLFKALKAEGLHSWINVPLIAQDQLIGTLNLGSENPSAFSTEDVDIARECRQPGNCHPARPA